ncbi:MAG: ABC transporter permease subunit [Pilosibacter sp.]
MQRLPRTLILGIASMVLAFGIGIPLGVTAAVHQNGWGDRISMIIALLGVSIPTFWLAMLFVLLFSLKLGWFPASGIGGWGVLCTSDSFTLFRWSCHSGTTGEIKYA